jgi:hypothetical protein
VLRIETAETSFGRHAAMAGVHPERMAELWFHRPPGEGRSTAEKIHGRPVPVPPSDHIDAGSPLPAFVNDGRWVVQCDVCFGAQLASKADHRFLCVDCLNAHIEGAWRPVLWPTNAGEIERALEVRPRRNLQNWTTLQTVEELLERNEAHSELLLK